MPTNALQMPSPPQYRALPPSPPPFVTPQDVDHCLLIPLQTLPFSVAFCGISYSLLPYDELPTLDLDRRRRISLM